MLIIIGIICIVFLSVAIMRSCGYTIVMQFFGTATLFTTLLAMVFAIPVIIVLFLYKLILGVFK